MTPVRDALEDYLRLRRELGFELRKEGSLLRGFVDFLEQTEAQHVTSELAIAWAKLPADVCAVTWRQRLGMVRGFARYLSTIDPDTEIPARDLLNARLQRVAPYISQVEIEALLAAAGALSPPFRAATFVTLIGLLASTGLRLGEALGLDRHDVDLIDGVLHAAPPSSTSSARSRCTPRRPRRLPTTPGCATAPCPARMRRRSS